jgi:hypothetical protein
LKDSTSSSAQALIVAAGIFGGRPRRPRERDLEIQHVSEVISGSEKWKIGK